MVFRFPDGFDPFPLHGTFPESELADIGTAVLRSHGYGGRSTYYSPESISKDADFRPFEGCDLRLVQRLVTGNYISVFSMHRDSLLCMENELREQQHQT